jgi:hypothetical protein
MASSQPDLGGALATASSSTNRTEVSNPLLEEALRKHLESLQPEERAAFEHCTPKEVIDAVAQLDIEHAKDPTRRYLARFMKIVEPLEKYFDLVGNMVGPLGSLHAGAKLGGIVWGALRFVVKVRRHRIFSSPPISLGTFVFPNAHYGVTQFDA